LIPPARWKEILIAWFIEYRYFAAAKDVEVIEIPISSFIGDGNIRISFQLAIDGFYPSKFSFDKDYTW
jgi:hypothetical protein